MKIKAEEKDIWEILYNLTDNAVRYGKQGGTVQILMSEGQLQVKDDGIGISPEHIGHIFEEFYRIDETRGNTAGGTGLGLSIVKAIVTAYGGRIDVEIVYGQGSVFTVTFPLGERMMAKYSFFRSLSALVSAVLLFFSPA